MKRLPEIVADFDAIADALALSAGREQLSSAERATLDHIPAGAERAIDVGCGDGVITRAIAARGLHVLGVDVSRGMIELARARTERSLPIEYRLLDIMADQSPGDPFDVVVAIAMVHHLPLHVIVPRLASLVAPGGVLLIQDVVSRQGPRHLAINLAAWLARRWHSLVTGSRVSSRVAAAYEAHGAGERYLEAATARDVYRALLPTSRVHDHLEWRYSVIWRRPGHPA